MVVEVVVVVVVGAVVEVEGWANLIGGRAMAWPGAGPRG